VAGEADVAEILHLLVESFVKFLVPMLLRIIVKLSNVLK
jgi:hypothetical protein